MKKITSLILTLSISFSVFAQEIGFKLNPVTDSILLGTGIALSGGDLILDNCLEVNRQKYDSSKNYDKDSINFFDRKLMQPYNEKLDTCADIGVALSMALPGVLVFTEKEEWATIAVMYAETLLIANGTKEILKLCVNRDRPYNYFEDEKPEDDLKDGDFCNSWPSGHSTMAFAGATFATYTFAKYFPESNWKYAVGAGSYALASATAGLRVASGNHFPTDVISGAVIGSVIGFAVPWLHTFNEKKDLNVALLADGVMFTVKL